MKYYIVGNRLFVGTSQFPIAEVKQSWLRKNVFKKLLGSMKENPSRSGCAYPAMREERPMALENRPVVGELVLEPDSP